MHETGIFEFEISEGDSYLEGRYMAHYRVPPFPFSLSIMSKKQAATVVVSVNEIY